MSTGWWTLPVFRVPTGSKSSTSTSSVGDGAMLDTARHDHELARPDLLDMRAELDPEPAPHAEEELILVGVMMPHELSLELGQLHVLSVERAHHGGTPVLADLGELVGQDYLLHVASTGRGRGHCAVPFHAIYVTRPGGLRERAVRRLACAGMRFTLYYKAL